MRYLSYSLLHKLSYILFNNALYSLPDYNVPKYPPLPALVHAHGQELPFVFSEMEHGSMATLNNAKHEPPPLEVINVDDSCTTRVCRVTPMSTELRDMSSTFEASALSA